MPGGRFVKPLALGAAAFMLLHLGLHLTWDRWFEPARIEVPWLLASRRSVLASQLYVGLMAGLLGVLQPGSWTHRLGDGALLAAGFVGALAVAFFLLGPERLMEGPPELWPVVLGSAVVLFGGPIAAATLLAGLVSQWGDR